MALPLGPPGYCGMPILAVACSRSQKDRQGKGGRSDGAAKAYNMIMKSKNQQRRRRHRALMLAIAAVSGLALIGPLRAALPKLNTIAFDVYRDGAELGHHKVSFRREADDLHVEIDIQLEVRLLFLTVFSYSHRNHEVWRDGRLVAIETETNDDGTTYWMRGRSTTGGFAVDGSGGRFLAPADVMPTSYWNPKTVEMSRLLDTQHGRLIEVEIAPAGVESVAFAGQPVEARRYSMTGDLTLDLWYTQQGDWAKTSFEARGASVVYARQGQSPTVAEIGSPARQK